MLSYDARSWYWEIPGITGEVFSSARPGMVSVEEGEYLAWLAGGNRPSRLNPRLTVPAAFAELYEVLFGQAPVAAQTVRTAWTEAGYLKDTAPAPSGRDGEKP